jgi:hypothetical protein
MRMGLLHQMVVDCARHEQLAKFLKCVPDSRVPSCLQPSMLQEIRTFTAARLDDEDILPAHALLNLDPRLAALELVEQDLGLRYAEVVADSPIAD